MHVVSGTGQMTIEETTYPLARGSVVAVPPFVQFTGWVEAGFAMKNIHYRLWAADGEPVEQGWRLPFVFTPDYFDHTEGLINELQALSEAPEKNPARSAALAHEIILDHWSRAEVCSIRSRIIDDRIRKVHDILIATEYEHYDAEALARASCLSISQMNRLFGQTFKCSPQKFWEANRLTAICMALKSSEITIGEIADAFGFNNQSYFSRWFKQRTAFAPVEYREQLALGDSIQLPSPPPDPLAHP